MKNLLIALLMIGTMSFLCSFSGCKKEDNTPTTNEKAYPEQTPCTSNCYIFTGTVKDRYTNKPLAGAKVYFEKVTSFNPIYPKRIEKITFATTDADGNYTVKFPFEVITYGGYYDHLKISSYFDGYVVMEKEQDSQRDSIVADKPHTLDFNQYPKAILKVHFSDSAHALFLYASNDYDKYIENLDLQAGKTVSFEVPALTEITWGRVYKRGGAVIYEKIGQFNIGEEKEYAF